MKRLLPWLLVLICLSSSSHATSITWSGTNGNSWDIDTTTNWQNASTPDVFVQTDGVTFDDTASNGTVSLAGVLQPNSVTVNNSLTVYTFGGTGQISGTTSLLKSGTGTLTISNTNSYTGGTVISAGTIIVTNASAVSTSGTITLGDGNTGGNNAALLMSPVGSAALTFARPVTVSSSGSGTATIGRSGTGTGLVTISSSMALGRDTTFQSSSSGTLSVTGPWSGTGNAIFTGGGIASFSASTGTAGISHWNGNLSVTGNSVVLTGTASLVNGNRNVNVDAGSGLALPGGSGTITLGALTGGGNVGNSGTTSINIAVGGTNSGSTFNGVIGGATIDGVTIGSAVNLAKTGSGTFTMTGTNTYTGTTSISQGTLALSGNGSIGNTPSILVTSGAVLDVSGLSSGTFALGSSQTLQAGRTSGFANDVVGNLATGGTVNIAGTGTAGTLTVSGNLSLTGGKLLYDFANVTTAGASDLISIGGSLSLSGTTTIAPNLLSGSLAIGTYTLISGTDGITSGNASNLVWGGSLNRQSVTFDTTTTPGTITMTVAGAGAKLIWTGTNGNNWDANTTTNWNNSGVADKFFNGDAVNFDDTSSNGNVVISGSLQPGAVTVTNNSTAYTFSGTGQIGGITTLVKLGIGVLTISNTNSYTGGTTISAGTVIASNASALSTGTITLGDVSTGTNNAALLVNQSGTTAVIYSNPIAVSNLGSGTAAIGRTGAGNGLVTISSTIALNRDTTFQSSSSGTLAVTGTFGGTGNAIFTGGGVTLLTASTGTAGVTDWGGNLFVTGSSVVVTGTSSIGVYVKRSMSIAAGSGVALSGSVLASFALPTLTGGGNIGNTGTAIVSISVGGSNSSSTFDGVIGGATIDGYTIGSSVNLTKAGSGTFTMTGNNTYTGSTTVSQGTLALSGNGKLSNTPLIMVNAGTVLDVSGLSSGTFTLGSSQTLQAGRISGFANDVVGNLATGGGTVNIEGSGLAGTLTVSGNLSLNGGNLMYDFSNVTTAGAHVNDLISIGGSLSLSGTTIITPNLLNGTLSTGTYTLISGGTSITSGSGAELVWGGTLSRQSITFNTTTTPGTITMTVAGAAGNLVWTGTSGNNWDTNTTANWNNSGTADKFFAGDNVTFNDTSSNGNVTLSSSLQPGSVTVNNEATAYTFSGTGQIGGLTGLLKSGTGTLTLSNTNSYTGGTVISAGTVVVASPNALGSGITTFGDVNTGTNNTALLVKQSGGSAITYSQTLVVSSLESGTATIGRTGSGNGLVTIGSSIALNGNTAFQSSMSGTLGTFAVTGTFSGTGNATFTGGGVTSLTATTGTAGGASAWSGDISVTGNSVVVTGTSTTGIYENRSMNVAAGSGIALSGSVLAPFVLPTLTGGGNIGNTGTASVNVSVGGSNSGSTFNGVIGGATIDGYTIGSSVNLTKTGSGTFTMTGNNTYTGSTTVSQGTLALSGNGNLSNTPSITITPGAVLDVSGLSSGTYSLGSSQTLQAGRTSGFATDVNGNLGNNGTINIAGSGTAGTLTINGNVGLNGGSVLYDFANTTTAGNHVNDLISVTGNVSLSGTTLITPNLLNGGLASGTYTLISGSGIIAGSAANLAWGGPATRQIISFDTTTTPGDVFMTVSGSAANLVWSGSNGATWDSSSTVFDNVSSSGTADKFYGLDNVTFADSGSSSDVVLSGSLQPGSVTVDNNSTAYTFSGSGQITGATTLIKSGSGSLTLTGTHTYTGATTVSGGNLTVTGSIASSVTVSAGGSLAGHGTVGAIAGSGTVAPGDPVIMTATQVDPSGGLGFNFQFGQSGAPTYTNAAASGNDVLHLTDPTPFKFALTSSNTVTLDFTGLILTQGETFYGGFFTDATIDPSTISGANFVYTGLNGATVDYEGLVTVPEADFASGTVYNGETMEFMVVAVPEPGTWALLGMGGMALLFIKKRRMKKTG